MIETFMKFVTTIVLFIVGLAYAIYEAVMRVMLYLMLFVSRLFCVIAFILMVYGIICEYYMYTISIAIVAGVQMYVTNNLIKQNIFDKEFVSLTALGMASKKSKAEKELKTGSRVGATGVFKNG